MAARDTRLLVLGAVALFEPVNGYQIRRELTSWQVDRWAHVNPGSIYTALANLDREGWVRRHDLVDLNREVAVYEMTGAGHDRLREDLVAALEQVDPHDRAGFQIAFGLLPLLDRPRVLAALKRRRVNLERVVAEFVRGTDDEHNGPPHARRGWVLWLDLAVAELGWLREVIADVESDVLRFEPDRWGWEPPADDPGRQMSADRERYRELLGRTS
jgi:DNA-binding PadR family transcriptional regulator